eukprot:4038219-Prymnesium_polylepis.1
MGVCRGFLSSMGVYGRGPECSACVGSQSAVLADRPLPTTHHHRQTRTTPAHTDRPEIRQIFFVGLCPAPHLGALSQTPLGLRPGPQLRRCPRPLQMSVYTPTWGPLT